jgi:hypothetical protein
VPKNLKRGGCKNAFFQVNGETIGGYSIEKKPLNGGGLFACPENQLVSRPCMNTHSTLPVVQSIILWKVCASLDSPKSVKKYSNKPNGVMIAVFGMSSVATGIW